MSGYRRATTSTRTIPTIWVVVSVAPKLRMAEVAMRQERDSKITRAIVVGRQRPIEDREALMTVFKEVHHMRKDQMKRLA